MSNAKPKVRFLCPIWGAPYIRRFLALSLPSFIAPGNLPALAELCDLEICILTVSMDEPVFSESSAFGKLKLIAPFKFISIDDLVLDQQHGVTLTLAYLRGVTDLGEEMTRQFVLFLNADIVLADGSFRGAARKILEGHPIILANSVRATSELVEPQLKTLIDSSQTLAVPPRELMRMALAAMHPLQVAKVVNSDLCYSIHANQFYWQADATTLVSRHFLMFMLCLKPERVVTEVGSFCDYSLVPEFCRTSPAIAMTDSDEFCALELQNADHESSYLRIGRPDPIELAESLSRWTTEDHRRNALDHTIVFHAGDLPRNLDAVNAEARHYIEHLISLMP